MNSDRIRPVVLAGICALALLLAAATISSTVRNAATGGAGGGTGGGIGVTSGGDVPGGFGAGEGGGLAFPSICLSGLLDPGTLLLAVGVVAVIGVVAAIRKDALGGVLLSTVLLIPVVGVYALLQQGCRSGDRTADAGGFLPFGGSGGGGSGLLGNVDPVVGAVATPIASVALVAGVGALALFLLDRSDDVGLPEGAASDEEDSPPLPDDAAIGDAAGTAADHLDRSAGADNEVYRAWVAMTEPLEVDHPEASTPAEFETAAVAAGMDPDDVADLTAVFEAVRYGDREVTDERVRRAKRALRRIERSHGEEGSA